MSSGKRAMLDEEIALQGSEEDGYARAR